MAKFTSWGRANKTDDLSWPVTVDDLNRTSGGNYEIQHSDHFIEFSVFDGDYENNYTYSASGTFAYTLDPTSGNITAVTGTVNTLTHTRDVEGPEGTTYSRWDVVGLSMSINDVMAASSGPNLEALLFAGDDDIEGAQYNDSLRGLGGADHLSGEGGKDTLKGGDGTDWLTGGGGNDKLFGQLDDDVLDGGAGKDTLTGNEGRDVFRYSAAPIAASADKITDFIHGEDKIQLLGSAFAAIGVKLERAEFYSKAGATKGHDSSDRIVYDPSSGRLYYDKDGSGGAASVLIATLSNKASLTRADFEIPAVFRDTAGNSLTQTFTGPTAITEYFFADGQDTIVFEATYPWSDVVAEFDMGSGNDFLQTQGGVSRVFGGAGRDTIVAGGAQNTVSGGDGNDSLTGGSGDDQIFGDGGNDVLAGLGRLEGGEGNDTLRSTSLPSGFNRTTLVGGPGDDLYEVTQQQVVIIEEAGGGLDTVRSTIDFYLPDFVQNLTLVGDGNVMGSGNTLDNVIKGNGNDNRIRAGSGNDTIDGGGGNDYIEGWKGKDVFLFTAHGDDRADKLRDFKAADDTIQLDRSAFLAIDGGGKLGSDQFLASASGLAQDSADRILYNTTDGKLYWDRDGSGTTYAPQHFATLQGTPTIKADDFLVV